MVKFPLNSYSASQPVQLSDSTNFVHIIHGVLSFSYKHHSHQIGRFFIVNFVDGAVILIVCQLGLLKSVIEVQAISVVTLIVPAGKGAVTLNFLSVAVSVAPLIS